MQAIILCGGKGERLGSLTADCPKGMITVMDKPILEYQLEWLKKYAVTKVVFACGYLHEKIQSHFGDGKKFSIDVDYSIEDRQLGRGGAIKKAWGKLSPCESFFVINGDIYTNLNLKQVLESHNNMKKEKNIKVTVCLFPYRSSFGIVKINKSGLIESFEEKPTLPFWINGGVYVFENDIKNNFPDEGDHETTTFPEYVKSGLIYGFTSNEYWKSIETLKDLNELSHCIRDKQVV